MIPPERIKQLNAEPIRNDSQYVLYWMQAAQRIEYNHALEFAISKANELKKPLVVCFGLTDNYPQANRRHYYFMLEGLKPLKQQLEKAGIRFIVRHANPAQCAVDFAGDAALVVADGGHLKIQRQWRNEAAEKTRCAFFEVETNLIVPPDIASDKEEFSAATFRPKINAQLEKFLKPIKHQKVKVYSIGLKLEKGVDINNTDKAVSKLDIEQTPDRTKYFVGGTEQAKKLLADFIKNKLARYADKRNDPNAELESNMSPYLHFGQISPLYIALQIKKSRHATPESCAAYLEQMIVRRELAHNFVYYNKNYDSFAALPPWAKTTLNYHKKDKRPYRYTPQQFENAQTHDPYWNAAQKQMTITGKMHGYMRMYWGKKILEWSSSPQKAFQTACYLNNKYELDGRDANGFTGVAWCFGKHDRPWPQRKFFGKIRYMNAPGLKRKFNADLYVKNINQF